MSGHNEDALALIEAKIRSVAKERDTAQTQMECHEENLDRARALVGIHNDTIRRLEGSKYLLLSQPPQEVHSAD